MWESCTLHALPYSSCSSVAVALGPGAQSFYIFSGSGEFFYAPQNGVGCRRFPIAERLVVTLIVVVMVTELGYNVVLYYKVVVTVAGLL